MIAQNQQSNLTEQPPPLTTTVNTLLNTFIDSICSQQSIENKICLISKIKQSIINNPHNYYHPYYQRVTFPDIYEFVIDSLSHQHPPSLLVYLLHVLALMVKYWIMDSINIKKLYDGILQLFQQRTFCGQNCFKFLTILIQTMQENTYYFNHDNQINQISINYSSIPTLKSSLENYFVYHLLNQLLAFANIFLERSVVRNQHLSQNCNSTNNRKAQDQGRVRVSQSLNSSSNSRIDTSNIRQNSLASDISQQYQLYKLQQSQPVIHSILSLIRACLSYDFSHTSRHQPQSQYQVSKSPIILPTKYSKYCRFSQYDILLKNQTTTELLNYLFLVCNSIQLKVQILNIIQAMTRIHFRYFKNKTTHKVHLEDIGYVVANLLTGLDLNQPISITQNSLTNRNTKVSIALGLGKILSLLLYHQPTFYLVEYSLMQMIIEHIQAFILNELLDSDNFKELLQQYNTNINKITNKFINSNKICKNDLCLLIEIYISPLYKLKDNIKNYLSQSQLFNQKINQLFIKIGQKYFQMLIIHLLPNQLNKIKKQTSATQQEEIINPLQQKYTEKIKENDQKLQTNNDINQPIHQIYKIETTPKNQIQNEQPLMTININIIDEINESSKQNQDKQQTQTNANLNQNIQPQVPNSDNNKYPQNNKSHGFLQSIIQENNNIASITNLLWIFRVYCPKHKYITVDEINCKRTTIINNISNHDQQNLINNIPANNHNINSTVNDNNNEANTSSTKTIKRRNPNNNTFQFYQNNNNNLVDNYQYWVISWLCNFQYLFHITGGHCRHSKDWEIQIKVEFMRQLIQDFHNVIQVYNSLKIQNNYNNIQHNSHTSQHQDKNQQEQIGKCLQICLSFMIDKIINQCRIPPQQYMYHIHIDIISIIQFITCRHFIASQQQNNQNNNKYNKHQQLPILPIVDALNNVNTYTYISKGYLQPIALSNNGNQTEAKIQKMLEIKSRCISIIAIIGKMLHIYTIVDQQCIHLLSPVIFLVMKIYVSNQQISHSFMNNNCTIHRDIYDKINISNNKDTNYNDRQLHQHIQQIFGHNYLSSTHKKKQNNQQMVQSLQLWPIFLMKNLVQQIHNNIMNSPHYHSNSKYAYNDMMGIYNIQQTYAHQLLINYMNWMQQQHKNNHKYISAQPQLEWPDHYLALLQLCIPIAQLQKKSWSYNSHIYNQSQNKKYFLVQIYDCSLKVISHCWSILNEFDKINNDGNCRDNCICFQYTSSIIKLYSELHGIDNKVSNLKVNSIELQQLLHYIFKHRQCIMKEQYIKIIPYIQSIIKIIHISNNGIDNEQDDPRRIINQIQNQYHNSNNIYNDHLSNSPNNYVIKIVQYFSFLLQLLSDLHAQYSNINNPSSSNHRQLYKLQQCILHNIIAYHHKNNHFNNSRAITGIIKLLQNVYINVTGISQFSSNHNVPNCSNGLSQLSQFIANTIKFNTQYLISKLIQYLQFNMIETLCIPASNQTNQHHTTFQKYTTLKIDNIIQVFTRNHALLQLLYQRYKTILQKNIINEIILQCVKYNEEKGVAWVINKLESWNNDQLCHLETQNSNNEKQNNQQNNQMSNQTNQVPNNQQQHKSQQQSILLSQSYNSPININLNTNKKINIKTNNMTSKQQQQKQQSQQINNDYIEKYINNIVNSNQHYNIFINSNLNNVNNTNKNVEIKNNLFSNNQNNSSIEQMKPYNNSHSQYNLNNPQHLDTNNQTSLQVPSSECQLYQYKNQPTSNNDNKFEQI